MSEIGKTGGGEKSSFLAKLIVGNGSGKHEAKSALIRVCFAAVSKIMNFTCSSTMVPWEPSRFRYRPLAWPWRAVTWLAIALILAPSVVQAADVAGAPQVVVGAANFRQEGNVRTIEQQTGAAVINWQGFDIKAGDITRFIQPGVNSAVLNRVLGANPSLLNGQLQANGQVYLINPNGIVVGPQGRIDVGAFFASTLNVSDDAFLKQGNLLFQGDSKAGVLNLGTINARDGDVMLIAYTVRNAGEINAPNGVAGLAAGSEVLLTHQGDQRIAIKSGLAAEGLEQGVENSGLIKAAQAELKAAGGSIYELAVNQSGVIRATGVEQKNGRVLLTAEGGAVKVSGEISARNADGSGGEILLGGDYQGKNAAVPNAKTVQLTESAKLDASASSVIGNGGKVIVWSDEATQFKGNIFARGGSGGGDGGLVEVSGKHWLDFSGHADASAPNGKRGSLLLDPDSLIISTADNQDLFGQGGFIMGLASPSYLKNTILSEVLATTDVEVRTGDEGFGGLFTGIAVNADVTWNTATTLMLKSGDNISINANIIGGTSGGLTLQPGGKSATASTEGNITLAADKMIAAGTLRLELNTYGPAHPADSVDLGSINLLGTVNADKIVLARNAGGVQGNVLINNVNNQISILEGEGAAGGVTGNLQVRNSSGGLTVKGNLGGVAGSLEILTSGNLTLSSGAVVANTGASDLVLASRGGSFINQAGASAVNASGSGRYLIYSDAPATTTKGGLTGASLYNRTFDLNAPASITQTGDRFIYSLSPTLTFKADNQTRAVGQANPALTYSVSGLLSGDTLVSAVTGTPTLSTLADGSSGVGTVPINIANGTLALTDLGYQLSLQNGIMDITAVPLNPLTITANSFSRIYGAFNPVFTASYAGLVGGDTPSVVTGLQFSTAATIRSGVGAYAITPFGASATGYGITYVPGLLTINPADLTIRANDFTRFYGSDNPTFTASYSGLVAGDTASVVSGLSLATAAVKGTGVGEYAITASGASAANYNISYLPGKLTIDKAPLTITADNQSKTYGSANPTLTATYTGLVNNETPAVVSGLTLGTAATTSSGVGNYDITISGGSAANYAISYGAGNLTINPATLTVRADNQTRFYGDANPTLTGTINGFVLGQNESVLTSLPTYVTSAGLTTGVGSYPIIPSGASAANYTFNYQNGSLGINPAVLAVRADNLVRVYGDANPTLTYSVSGLKNGDSADGKFFVFTFGTVAAPNSGVGNYTIIFNGNDTPNDNYTTFFANGTLTVQPRPLTIRTDAISREYGLANPAFTATFTGLASFDTPSVIPGLGFTTAATSASGVGDYSVSPTSGDNANYAITRLPNLMSITPAPISVYGGDYFKTYGDANPTFIPSITSGALRNGDTVGSVNLRIQTAANTSSGVGNYGLNAAISSPNYALTSIPGNLQILPAIIDVTVGSGVRLYGDANPSSVSVSATGLKLSDTAASVVSLAHAATALSPIGNYAITATEASPNYQVRSVTPGNLQIFPAPLDVVVGNASRIYGDANPTTVPVTVTGFKFGEASASAVQITHSATLNSGVGSYPVSAVGINPNYVLHSVTPGALQITPAQLDVRFFNADRFYGDANATPAFDTVTGLKFGESFASVVSRGNSAVLQSGVGSYPFTATSLSPNYQIHSVDGSLRILPAPLSVTAANTTRFYGDPNPANSLVSVSGLKFGESPASIVTLNSQESLQQIVGTYNILASSLSPNYQVTFVTGTMRVNPRPITLTANDATKFFGENNPGVSYSIGGSGIASFDSAEALLAGVQGSSVASINSTVGTYPITLTAPSVPNYAITLRPGTLTVNPRPITLKVDPLTRYYYDPNPEVVTTISGMGLASFHTLADVISWEGKAPALDAGIGAYPLFPRILDSRNYDITLWGNMATILPRPVTLSVNHVRIEEGETVPATFTLETSNLPAGVTVADLFPNLTFSTIDPVADYRPLIRPAVPLEGNTFPNQFPSSKLSAMVLDADGNILNAPNNSGASQGLKTKFFIFPADPVLKPLPESTSVVFSIPVDFAIGGKIISRKFITLDGYNDNPNITVTSADYGRLEVFAPDPDTLARRAAEAEYAASKQKLVVGTGEVQKPFSMPAIFKSDDMQPYLKQAALDLMKRLLSSGDTDTYNTYFKDGVDGFLNGFKDDPKRQMMLIGALGDLVLNYASMPSDKWPPALAEVISEASMKAKEVKLQQAKEVASLYNEWLKGPDPSIPQLANPYSLNMVPNFANQVKVNYFKDAAIVVGTSLGAGVTTGAIISALPVSVFTFTSASGAPLASIASTSLIAASGSSGVTAGAVAATIAGPVTVAVLAAATVTIAGIQLTKQPQIKAAIAEAQEMANANDARSIALNLSDKDDRDIFAAGFLKFMSGGAF